jgi:hypothetical protein
LKYIKYSRKNLPCPAKKCPAYPPFPAVYTGSKNSRLSWVQLKNIGRNGMSKGVRHLPIVQKNKLWYN